MKSKIGLLLLLCLSISCRKINVFKDQEIISHEFHYDREYSGYYYRVISAHRFSEPVNLKDSSRRTIKNLLFDGLEYKDYIERGMEFYGNDFTDMGKYRFNPDIEFSNNSEWDNLMAERRPAGAEEPLFEILLSFSAHDYVYASADFIVYKHEWSSNPSDAAHGLYGVSYTTIDLKNERITGLYDLLMPQTLEDLDSQIRSLLRQNEVYTEELYPHTLPEPDSFLFEKSGLRLIWNPYSIASYARGIVEITLPYKNIGKHLTTDGKLLAGSF